MTAPARTPFPPALRATLPRRIACSRFRPAPLCALLALAAAGCGDDQDPLVAPGAGIVLEVSGLPHLDPVRDGTYAVWLVDGTGAYHAAGTIDPDGDARASFAAPVGRPIAIEVTLEPPGASAASPSPQRVLRGVFHNGVARLTVAGALTSADLVLERQPGQFTVMTVSDNARNGYPSNEQAGLWLLNLQPRETRYNEQWVRLTPLREGWVYEGWIVRDYGSPDEVWLSYGKFTPDRFGSVSRRDDTGSGPFSGAPGFAGPGPEEYPGNDWLENPLGLPLPAGLSLPLDLLEPSAGGGSRWTHVVSIEPATDRGEPIGAERPFFLQPYRDPVGLASPGTARTITFHADALPTGIARGQRR